MTIQRSLLVTNTGQLNIDKVQLRVIDFLDGKPSTLRLFVYMRDGSRAFMDAPEVQFEDDTITVETAKAYALGTNWEDRNK